MIEASTHTQTQQLLFSNFPTFTVSSELWWWCGINPSLDEQTHRLLFLPRSCKYDDYGLLLQTSFAAHHPPHQTTRNWDRGGESSNRSACYNKPRVQGLARSRGEELYMCVKSWGNQFLLILHFHVKHLLGASITVWRSAVVYWDSIYRRKFPGNQAQELLSPRRGSSVWRTWERFFRLDHLFYNTSSNNPLRNETAPMSYVNG